jgi:hypothetical protein
VALRLELDGSLSPRLSDGGLDLVDGSGVRVLRYDHLSARDARGRELASSMTLASAAPRRAELALVVETEGAAFPVTVDPLATSATPVFDGPQAGANFGRSVATAGDVDGDGYSDIIIGAPYFDDGHAASGKVFVYSGSPAGVSTTPVWTAQANLTNAYFGDVVATAGDVNGDGFSDVIVGAHGYSQLATNGGAVLAWYGSASGLGANGTPLNADFSNVSSTQDALFGIHASGLGDVDGDGTSDVAVGGQLGIVVYRGSSAGLTKVNALALPGSNSELSGGDVNGDGYADVLVSSSPAVSDARIYFGPGLSTQSGDYWSYSPGGTVAAVGDVNGDGISDVLVGDNGSVKRLFFGGSPRPNTTESWTLNLPGVLAAAGDVNGDGYADLLFGCGACDFFGNGHAWLFFGSNDFGGVGLTSANADWDVGGTAVGGRFGFAVGTAGDVNGDGFSDILVGAPNANDGAGSVSLFLGGAELPDSTHSFTLSRQEGAEFGMSVAYAGDVNGDGYGDLIVGAPLYDGGQTDEGAAFVFYGTSDGLDPTAWSAEYNSGLAHFGSAVAGAGDVNGDGFDDVIVGAEDYTGTGNANQGAAFVWLGGAGGVNGGVNGSPANVAWKAVGVNLSAHLGTSVASAGDVNGDGFADVIMGVPDYSHGQSVEGIALVFRGSASGLGADGSPANADALLEANKASAHFGTSVASAGDVNGDGFSDVIVGAPDYDVTAFGHEGAAFVFKGTPKGLSPAAIWSAFGPTANSDFGRAVSSAGDVNGDGFSDVVVGEPLGTSASATVGRIYVYRGNAGGLSNTATTRAGGVDGAEFGAAVSCAGDVNGDGFSDVLVGAPKRTSGESEEGAVFLYLGGASFASSSAFSYLPNVPGEHFGASVAAGDVNGDGWPDVIAGGPGISEIRVFLGNRGPGRARRFRQRRTGSTTLIPRLGVSDATDGFKVTGTLSSPFGLTHWIAMEVEAKPLGTSFDDTGHVLGALHLDVLSASATESLSGLPSGTPHHWRARTRFDPVTTIHQGHGPWFTLPTTSVTETALRTKRPCISSGDVNLSGSPEVSDIFYLINALFAGGPKAPGGCGDVDGSGAIDVADVFYLINFLFAGGPPPV